MNKKTLKKLALGTAMLVAASKKAAAQPQTLILTTVLRLY